jgi:hypothetical protein
MKTIKMILSFIILGFIMNSCNNDNNPMKATYPYAVRMTDAPSPYDAVYIDLQGVEIKGSGGQTVALNVHPDIYNLLDFTNGTNVLILSPLHPHCRSSQ